MSSDRSDKAPSLLDALIPIMALIGMLSASVYFFGEDSSYGPNQVALFVASGIAIMVSVKNGNTWDDIVGAISNSVSTTVNAILILLMVGALIGSWIVSGTVPTMIYYGLKLINPQFFFVTACVVCALASISIGSSWSVIGTIGLGLFGVANSLGIAPEIAAGAIVSGAYFGDKMSPLSDTTNLSPAVAGTDLFTHIRHMTWTTFPAIGMALILYTIIGLGTEVDASAINVGEKLALLEDQFGAGPHLLLPILVVIGLAWKKYPAFPSMMVSVLAGIVLALIFQQDLLAKFGAAEGLGTVSATFKAVWTALFGGYTAATPDAELNELLSRGGMAGVMNTIWLIISAITFGAIMEHAGFLQRLIVGVMSKVRSSGSLIFTTVCTCIGINVVAGDQYIAIVLPARMYKMEFKNRNLAPQNLSRTVEDAGTVTSALIPWNTCGAFISGVLGISALAYAPYAFFNIFSPIVSVIYGVLNFKLVKLDESEVELEAQKAAAE
ncbi:MAG: Na+/H+ antiporter NhaC [Kordiimonas sp.]